MEGMRGIFTALARVAIVSGFVAIGVNHLRNWEKAVEWTNQRGAFEKLGYPPQTAPAVLGCMIAFLFVGSAMVALGAKARIGAGLLMLAYIVDVGLLLGPALKNPDKRIVALNALVPCVALAGALLFIVVRGAGPGSVDGDEGDSLRL